MGRRCALALAVLSALLCQVSREPGVRAARRQVGRPRGRGDPGGDAGRRPRADGAAESGAGAARGQPAARPHARARPRRSAAPGCSS